MDGSSLYTPAVLEVDDLTIENIRSAWTTGKVSTLDDGVEMNEHGVRGETWTLHYASLTSPFA